MPLTQNFSIRPASPSRTRKGTVLVYTKGRKGQGRHLLTIPIYSSSSVLFNTFLGNTANSCKNRCTSEEQKREDATAEHAEIILQTLMGSQLLQAPPALTENLKNQPSIKAQYCTTWKAVTAHPRHLPTVEPAAQWLLPPTESQGCAKPAKPTTQEH